MNLAHTPLFRGIASAELASLLACLGARRRTYRRGEMILAEGTVTDCVGVVEAGRAMISCVDVWGNASVLGSVEPGAVFAEAYACTPGQPLLISVIAAEETAVLFLPVGRMAAPCERACPFHALLLRNLLSVCAGRSLQLSRRMLHTTPKSIRGRLLSYLSDCARTAGANTFTIPYNRQQLADYLGVDRSAMCSTLSKLQRAGAVSYRKNRFVLHTPQAL